jgi:zinc transporter ZupT
MLDAVCIGIPYFSTHELHIIMALTLGILVICVLLELLPPAPFVFEREKETLGKISANDSMS